MRSAYENPSDLYDVFASRDYSQITSNNDSGGVTESISDTVTSHSIAVDINIQQKWTLMSRCIRFLDLKSSSVVFDSIESEAEFNTTASHTNSQTRTQHAESVRDNVTLDVISSSSSDTGPIPTFQYTLTVSSDTSVSQGYYHYVDGVLVFSRVSTPNTASSSNDFLATIDEFGAEYFLGLEDIYLGDTLAPAGITTLYGPGGGSDGVTYHPDTSFRRGRYRDSAASATYATPDYFHSGVAWEEGDGFETSLYLDDERRDYLEVFELEGYTNVRFTKIKSY